MRKFSSVASFVEFLESRKAAIPIEQRRGANDAGIMLVHEAQAKIGEYQEAAGPFPQWAPLSENTLTGGVTEDGHHYPGKIELGFAPPDNPLLRTGQMRGSIEHIASEHEVVIGSHDPVARLQEFGTDRIPARSFIGSTMFTCGHDAARHVFKCIIAALTGNSKPPLPEHHHE